MRPFSLESSINFADATLSERLSYALHVLKISQTELARRVGVKQPTIQYLCSNNAKKSAYTFQIAQALGISDTWLATGKGGMSFRSSASLDSSAEQRSIPFYHMREIKYCGDLNAFPLPQKQLATTVNLGSKGFALQLEDSAMSPIFDQNTVALFNPDKPPQNNTFVVAFISMLQIVIFRQYIIKNDEIFLKPLNTALYKMIEFDPADIVLGVMVEARWGA